MFCLKRYCNKTFKNKVCIGHRYHKRQLLRPKKCMGYYQFFSRKLVRFGIFWEQVPKIDKWGIIPTQFSPLNTNLLWKLKERFKCRFQKSPWCQIFRDEGNLKIFHMFRFFNFDSKSVFSDKNWVGIIPHMSMFGTCSQNIPNQTSLREKNR